MTDITREQRAAGDSVVQGPRPKFEKDTGFHRELRRRVAEYFHETGLPRRGGPRMIVKTVAILVWFAASYGLLVFVAGTWWLGVLFASSLAMAIIGIGFSIQHDANHGAYSERALINRLIGKTMDLVGASSHIWRWKHNVFHHTYPNLDGVDDDIGFLPFARLSPEQPRYRLHHLQHVYLWVLYGFLGPKWHFVDDFKSLITGRIANNRFPRPRGWELWSTMAGKAVFFSWALVIPMVFHPWWVVLLFYVGGSFVIGVVMAVVFQLAHCVEEADFPACDPKTPAVPSGWAAHQVYTSVDFAQRNRFLTWYLGGLNFQIEHHLFPQVSHVHYPQLAAIVRSVCAEHGVRYRAHETVLGALRSHWRWLRRLGQPASSSGF